MAQDVERVANGIDAPELSHDLLRLPDATEDLEALERVLLGLVLLRAVSGTEHEGVWRTPWTKIASDAIPDLRMPGLLPLRLALLDDLLAANGTGLSLAELHFQRANTRSAMRAGHPKEVEPILSDLHAAMRLSLEGRDESRFAAAVVLWARILVTGPDGSGGACCPHGEVDRAIEQALGMQLDAFDLARLHQAKAQLARLRDPGEAVNAFEVALSLAPAGGDLWTELAAELVETLTHCRRLADAVQRGRALMEQASCAALSVELGMLHLAVGGAHACSGQMKEARRLLEAALAQVRGRDGRLETRARLDLARLGLMSSDRALLEEHIRNLRDHREELAPALQRELMELEAAEAATRGDFAAQQAALEGALSCAVDESTKTRLRLELAQVALAMGSAVEGLDTLLMRAIDLPAATGLEDSVFALACDAEVPLSEETRTAVATWAQRLGRPNASARTWHLGGQIGSAREVLREALTGKLEDRERLDCSHQLLTLLGSGERDERRRLCATLECLLADVQDRPRIRLDLAAALSMDAEGNPDVLQEVVRHVQRALDGVVNEHEARFGHQIMARAILDLMHALLGEPSQKLAEVARPLLGDLTLSDREATGFRIAAVAMLLLPGPVVNTDALKVAQGLVVWLAEHAREDAKVVALKARLQWIERCVETGTNDASRADDQQGPLDQLPSWFIGLVHGKPTKVSAEELGEGVAFLVPALRWRPEVADEVCSTLLPLQHRLGVTNRQALLGAIYDVVQVVVQFGDGAWPALRRAIKSVRKKDHHPTLRLIESVVFRATAASVTATDRAVSTSNLRAPSVVERHGSPERARKCFRVGVELMRTVLEYPDARDAADKIAAARTHLAEAVGIGRKRRMSDLLDFLISFGNVCKTPPGDDLKEALLIYEEAEGIDGRPDQKATLWKVHADALLTLGGPEDIRRAARLVQQSLSVRTGWRRSEALLSTARIAAVHPDLDPGDRAKQASDHLMNAVRADRVHAERYLGLLLQRLAEWQQHRPDDPGPSQCRSALKTLYPNCAAQIDEAVALPSAREMEVLRCMGTHPAVRACMAIRTRLMSAAELGSDPLGWMRSQSPAAAGRMTDFVQQRTLVGRPDEAEALLLSLCDAPQDVAWPGVLAARVLLLAHLVRLGRHSSDEVRTAMTAALEAVANVDEPLARALLRRELALVWAPPDHTDDRVRDFPLAVDLLRQCVVDTGGEEQATEDTLAWLARALLYSPAGDLRSNLKQAKRLFEICLNLAKRSGSSDMTATRHHDVSVVESQLGIGGRLESLRASEMHAQQAVRAARSPSLKAQYTAHYAWVQTQIGMHVEVAERKRHLEQALATFDHVDIALLDVYTRRFAEGNRVVCEAALARMTGGREAEIAVLRRRIHDVHSEATPHCLAMAKHNLAQALLCGEVVTQEQLAEGLGLLNEAAEVRTIEANPRHHWETAMCAGMALLQALQAKPFTLWPMTPGQAAQMASEWLHSAVEAARVLGRGEELVTAALSLCNLGCAAGSVADMQEQTEHAWAIVREAAPYLLLHEQLRHSEARMASHVACILASRLAEPAVPASMGSIAYVLQDQDAEFVGRWIGRSQAPSQRPLRARFTKPNKVSAALWEKWRASLVSRDQRELANVMGRIHEEAPHFLAEDVANESTWAWLTARPGSIAVALVLTGPTPLVLLLHLDAASRRRTWVVGLDLPVPPVALDSLPDLMRGAIPDGNSAAAIEALAAWLKKGLVGPIEELLGRRPSTVLWCPDPSVRLVAPGAIWPSVPVATTTCLALALPDLATAPGRRRSTLLALADPGPKALDPRFDLRGLGVRSLQNLANAAAKRGPVRLMGSVGDQYGRKLLGERTEVRDTPASAGDVLAEAGGHDFVVLLAHGEVETLEQAALLCIDRAGSIDRLDVIAMGREPDCFAGATLLLLSCDSGRVGDSLVEPGGIAGALVSAGARCVIAPLTPVQLDIAVAFGQALLADLAAGEEPSVVLAKLQVSGSANSPALGAPPPKLSERQAAQSLQRLSFVAWVG